MSIQPKKLAIYYGWPSTVNGTYSVAGAAGVFKNYDIVVFGAGLEESSHGDHQNTKDIIDHSDMANTECYGYITMGNSTQTIKAKIDDWHSMGGSNQKIAGIFCDEFGYDFNTTRSKQNTIVDYIHNKSNPSLKAFVNAWDPDDVFSGNPGHKLNTDDLFLVESYVVKTGNYETESAWDSRNDKLVTYKSDAKIVCITTPDSNGTFSQSKLDFAYFNCAMYGFEAFGWGEKNYSSAGGADSLPLRSRPGVPEGTKLDGSVSNTGSVYEINTNVGFHVDWSDNTKDTRLE